MELFLLLSIGMSIVAFISIALNQPPTSSVIDHNLESVFPGEHLLLSSEQIGFLKLEDQVILHDFDTEGQERVTTFQEEIADASEEGLQITAAS